MIFYDFFYFAYFGISMKSYIRGFFKKPYTLAHLVCSACSNKVSLHLPLYSKNRYLFIYSASGNLQALKTVLIMESATNVVTIFSFSSQNYSWILQALRVVSCISVLLNYLDCKQKFCLQILSCSD